MAYLDRDKPPFAPDWWRVLLGIVAAPIIPALLFGSINRGPAAMWPSISPIVALGFLSVLTLYLPLLAWRLPDSRRPLLTCVLAGIFAAPGPLGYLIGTVGLLVGAEPRIVIAILLFAAPFGAVGGFVFWFFAIWEGRRVGIVRDERD